MKLLGKQQMLIVISLCSISVVAALAVFLYFYFRKTDMKTSAKGIALIKRFEQLRLKAYKCTAGVWTIGWGHTSGVKEGDTCTAAQAEEWLKQDIADAEDAVNWQGLKLNQNQFDALVSFVFNAGEPHFRKSTLLKLVKENPADPEIAKEFEKWVYSGGKVTAGLVNRREVESNLYFA